MKTHALLAFGLALSLPSAASANELDLDGASSRLFPRSGVRVLMTRACNSSALGAHGLVRPACGWVAGSLLLIVLVDFHLGATAEYLNAYEALRRAVSTSWPRVSDAYLIGQDWLGALALPLALLAWWLEALLLVAALSGAVRSARRPASRRFGRCPAGDAAGRSA